MEIGEWVTFFACLLACITFYYTVCSMLLALSCSWWDRFIGIVFTVIGFYSGYVVVDFIIALVKEDLMDLRDWIAFFACLVICGAFYGSVGCVLVTLSGSKWERAIWITFMALSFYASWAIIDYILMLVK